MMPVGPPGKFPSILFPHLSFFNSPMAFILSQDWVFAIAQTQTSSQEISEIILSHISSSLMIPSPIFQKRFLFFYQFCYCCQNCPPPCSKLVILMKASNNYNKNFQSEKVLSHSNREEPHY